METSELSLQDPQLFWGIMDEEVKNGEMNTTEFSKKTLVKKLSFLSISVGRALIKEKRKKLSETKIRRFHEVRSQRL
jgi:hypothetical protein